MTLTMFRKWWQSPSETALALLASKLQLGSKASSWEEEEEEEVGRCGCVFVKDVMCLCACHYD